MRSKQLAMLAVLAGLLTSPSEANAARPLAAEAHSLYTCANGGLSHVALTADPAPCCTGSFGCPQLLSNTGLLKPKRDNHT